MKETTWSRFCETNASVSAPLEFSRFSSAHFTLSRTTWNYCPLHLQQNNLELLPLFCAAGPERFLFHKLNKKLQFGPCDQILFRALADFGVPQSPLMSGRSGGCLVVQKRLLCWDTTVATL